MAMVQTVLYALIVRGRLRRVLNTHIGMMHKKKVITTGVKRRRRVESPAPGEFEGGDATRGPSEGVYDDGLQLWRSSPQLWRSSPQQSSSTSLRCCTYLPTACVPTIPSIRWLGRFVTFTASTCTQPWL